MADLNSRDFQTRLVHDLINGAPTIQNMKVYDQRIPSIRGIDIHGAWGSLDGVTCELSFVYNYGGEQIPMHIIFNGTLYFDLKYVPKSGDGYTTPKEGGHPTIVGNDYSAMEVSLMTPEGDELDADWINQSDNIADQLGQKVLDKYISDLEYSA